MVMRSIATIFSLCIITACASPPAAIQGTDKGAAEIACPLAASRAVQYAPSEIKAIRVTLKDAAMNSVAVQSTFQGTDLASRLSISNATGVFTCTIGNLTFKDKSRQIDYAGTIEAFFALPAGPATLIGTAAIPQFNVKQNKVTTVSTSPLQLIPSPPSSTGSGSAQILLPIIDSVPASSSIH